jgi:hypothetical protein
MGDTRYFKESCCGGVGVHTSMTPVERSRLLFRLMATQDLAPHCTVPQTQFDLFTPGLPAEYRVLEAA